MRKTLPLSFLLAVAVSFPARGGEFKTAARMFLSGGDVVEAVCTSTGGGSRVEAGTTLTVRFPSGIVTVSSKVDYIRKHGETRISNGKTVLELRDEFGYYADNLPVPLQVKIGDDVYRVLLKPNTLTDDQKRMQAAVAKLPAPFLTALQELMPIADFPECSIPNLTFVSGLFDGPLPENSITSVKKLEPAEIEALIRDAVK